MSAACWVRRRNKLGPADLYMHVGSDGLVDLTRIPVKRVEARRRVRTGRPRQKGEGNYFTERKA